MKPATSIIGAAGEHYVMYQLLRRNLIAALAAQGTPDVDILVTNSDLGTSYSIQVKTRSGAGDNWPMREKHETIVSDSLIYCFIDFGKDLDPPSLFIVPSAIVADVLQRAHRAWLAQPGRGGRPHQDGPGRRLLYDYGALAADANDMASYRGRWLEKYRNNWSILGRQSI